ncbi:unnamed protein product [Ectocarpus sp. 6 AP-2014]
MTTRSWQPLCYVLLLALSPCQRASSSIDSNPVPSTAAATSAAVLSDSAPPVDHHRQHVPETDDIGGGGPDSCLGSQHQHQRQRGENMVMDGEEGTNKKPHSPPALCSDEVVVEVRKGEEAAAASTTTAPGSTTDDMEDEGQEGVDSSSSIPERYIVGCGGDVAEAGRRWKATVEWRKENKVDEILETPQPHFHECRQVFPVFLHGRSRKGMPVLWERIGKVDLAKANELELPLSVLTPNYVFLNECVWRLILDKGENDNDDAQFITVEDVAGVWPWHLTPKVLSVLRALTGTMKAHYVERCHKSYIINAPRAFTALWRVVSAMLDARTRAKISILGTNYLEEMKEEIDISQIPPEYGGSSGRAIDDSDDERKIQALVARLNLAAKGQGIPQKAAGDGGKPADPTRKSQGGS